MPAISVGATRTIAAPAPELYAVLADYRDGHPRILPEPYFSDLQVERGGVGAGTEIRFRMHVLGGTHTLRARIDEPAPGRTLTETNLDTGAVTTFRVRPLDGGQRTSVTIVTRMAGRGLRGLIERWVLPPLLRKIFAAELANLERFVLQREQVAAGV
jgi:hypothetical protein